MRLVLVFFHSDLPLDTFNSLLQVCHWRRDIRSSLLHLAIELARPGAIFAYGAVSGCQRWRLDIAFMLPNLKILLEIVGKRLEDLPGDEPIDQRPGNRLEKWADLPGLRD